MTQTTGDTAPTQSARRKGGRHEGVPLDGCIRADRPVVAVTAGLGRGSNRKKPRRHVARSSFNPLGAGVTETILMKNGRFSKTFKVAEMKTLDTGKYTVGQGYIHFDIEDHEPKVYKGKPMHWIKSETVFFQMAGPDRMLCEDRITGGRCGRLTASGQVPNDAQLFDPASRAVPAPSA